MDRGIIVDLLNSMVEIVDDHAPWKDKSKAIKDIVAESEQYQLAFGEFLTWFEEEEEEDEEEE